MSSSPSAAPLYELLYHPTIPGRGEYIRLALEITHTPYTDVANATHSGPTTVQSTISIPTHDASGNPPVFAPPALRVPNGGRNGAPLLLSQTANILLYLGPRLGLVPADDEVGRLWVNQMTLTALDWSDEAHEVHHPVGSSLWYEEQVEEAKRRSEEVRRRRVPRFAGFFEGVLRGNGEGGGEFLVGGGLTYADTTLWGVVDGFRYAFPKEMGFLEESGEYPLLFGRFYPRIKERLRGYLGSERRMKFGMGVFRHYPELDRQ